MIWGKLLLGYTRDALHQCSVFSDKGTKEPVHSRDGGLYAKACPKSQGKCDYSPIILTRAGAFVCIQHVGLVAYAFVAPCCVITATVFVAVVGELKAFVNVCREKRHQQTKEEF